MVHQNDDSIGRVEGTDSVKSNLKDSFLEG